MSRRVTVMLVDDVDGEVRAHETVEFSIDGVHYAIDLCVDNAEKLRGELSMWIEHARRVSRRKGRRGSLARRGRDNFTHARAAAVREWALQNGCQVSPRGPVPSAIVNAFRAATGTPESI